MLQPWGGHRRGATVAIPSRLAASLHARGVVEVVAMPTRIATAQTTAAPASDTPASATPVVDAPRRRGRPPGPKPNQ